MSLIVALERVVSHDLLFTSNGNILKISLKYCLKKEQDCTIRCKNSRRSREFLNLIIHDCEFLNGFKVSDIDVLYTPQEFVSKLASYCPVSIF